MDKTPIRLKSLNSDIRVIHTSGLGMYQANQTLDCGCKGFLAKPFKIEELSNMLKEYLEITDEQEKPASHF